MPSWLRIVAVISILFLLLFFYQYNQAHSRAQTTNAPAFFAITQRDESLVHRSDLHELELQLSDEIATVAQKFQASLKDLKKQFSEATSKQEDTLAKNQVPKTRPSRGKITPLEDLIRALYKTDQKLFCSLHRDSHQNLVLPPTLSVMDMKYGNITFQQCVESIDDIVSHSIRLSGGNWEPEISGSLLEKLKVVKAQFPQTEIYFLDIGTHIGSHTLHMAKNGFQVLSFEPLPANIRALRFSLCLNPNFNVTLFPTALGSQKTTCKMYSGNNNIGDGIVDCSNQTFPPHYVQRGEFGLNMLDSFLDIIPVSSEQNKKKIGVMKMDVEGSEPQVVLGGWKFFKAHKIPYVVTEIFSSVNRTEYLGFWHGLGYEIHGGNWTGPIYGPSEWNKRFVDTRDDGAVDIYMTLAEK